MKRAALIGHKVVILGSGREGMATYQALLPVLGPDALTVWSESGPACVALHAPAPLSVEIRVGRFDEGLSAFDVAIRSPGIPVDHPALVKYRDQGGQVLNPSSIFLAEREDVPVIGVTGSKGKSTTASILAHVLASQGRAVTLAGNIGKPLISCLDHQSDVVVAELSSYQLSDLEGRLSLGVITRLFPEHVDWHGSLGSYYGAKKRLFDLVAGGPVFINQRDLNLVKESEGRANRRLVNPLEAEAGAALHRADGSIQYLGQSVFDSSQWTLCGDHNIDNAVMALAVVEHLGDQVTEAAKSLCHFQGLSHRLSVVPGPQPEDGVIRWVNDSIATTPHATRAALEAFADQPVVLMVGGYERGGDWSVVIECLKKNSLIGLVCLPDNGARIAKELLEAGVVGAEQIAHAHDMNEAIAQALRLVQHRASDEKNSSATVLLSPGAPSFGHYRDFEHRGACFMDVLAQQLKVS